MTDPRNAYRQAAAQGVSPVQSVIRLYEQIIEDLRQALQAIEQNQIELRTNKINHAILVIGHLQSRLNFQRGGKVAQNLDRLYDVLRRELLQAQFQVSAQILSGRIDDLLAVRAAWLQVERAEDPAADSVEAVAAGTATVDSAPARADWKG
jgi:flagellar protein FliS